MNKIEKLIQEYCPEGVPHKSLLEIGTLTRGRRFVKDDIRTSGVPCIHYGELYTKYGISASSAFSFLEAGLASNLRKAKLGDVIIVSAGETVEDIGKAVAWLGESEVVVHDACYIFRSDLDPKYASYFFATNSFRSQIKRFIASSKVSAVSPQNMGKALIPVPPLRIQQEIVYILDKFTELEVELEVELDARSSQYESYRDALFDFGAENTAHPLRSFLGGSTFEGVEWVAIGNLGELFPGLSGKSKEDFSNGNRPFVSYLDIGNNASLPREIVSKVAVGLGERQNEIKLGDILFTGSSEDKKGVGLTSEVEYELHEPTYLNSFCFGLRPEPGRFAKGFLKHLFRSSGIRQKVIACGNGVTRINISKKLLLKIEVPQPPLVLQEAIVSILDKLDAIVTGTQASLPAEIQARRKQYEYYRNKLLTFKELDAA